MRAIWINELHTYSQTKLCLRCLRFLGSIRIALMAESTLKMGLGDVLEIVTFVESTDLHPVYFLTTLRGVLSR